MSIFSNRLKEAMKLRGVSQSWLAHAADTSEANISRYKNAIHDPGVLTILPKIANALNVSADYLIGISEFKSINDSSQIDEQILVQTYSKMSNKDKETLWKILDKYLSDSDREQLSSL